MAPRGTTEVFLRRIATPDDRAFRVCPIPGCGRPSQAHAGLGASPIHCDRCCRRRNRHGDLVKPTYTAAQLHPYFRAAESYIAQLPHDQFLTAAEQRLALLLENAGPVQRIVDLPRMHPRDKARAALARMRRKEVLPRRLLTIALAVAAAVSDDPVRPIGTPDEFRITQLGKRALRTASGYHAKYGPHSQYDRYPRSAGRMLRVLGKLIDEASAPALRHLDGVVRLKQNLLSGNSPASCDETVK